jgi:hypothetical protein
MKRCGHCKSEMDYYATVCPTCRRKTWDANMNNPLWTLFRWAWRHPLISLLLILIGGGWYVFDGGLERMARPAEQSQQRTPSLNPGLSVTPATPDALRSPSQPATSTPPPEPSPTRAASPPPEPSPTRAASPPPEPSPTRAASPPDVDCGAANTRVEQTVCASPDLVALGQIIADGYTAALSLTDSPAFEVRQRFDWLQRRDRCNSERGEMLVSCVQSVYEERATEISSRLDALNKDR